MTRALPVLALLSLPAVAVAQDAATTFRSSVDVVALNVVVTDADRKFVTGLEAQDFEVYEDGVRQDVTFFAANAVPLDLAILMDTSASMTDKIATAQQAAIGFVETLRDGDRLSVVDIKDATRVLFPLTGDLRSARAAILSTVPKGGTALFNGLYLTLKELVKQRRANGEVRRQAIAVFSDGEDTASLIGFDDVMAEAKQAGIAIYTITLRSAYAVRAAALGGPKPFSQALFSMKAIAQETGARSFFPADIAELPVIYAAIAEELANQYALGYTPKNGRRDGSFRRVIVRVDRSGAQIRTRTGYTSPRPDRTTSTH